VTDAPGDDRRAVEVPDAELHVLDGGHFALESHGLKIAVVDPNFLRRQVASR
jgi:hypothetical protein